MEAKRTASRGRTLGSRIVAGLLGVLAFVPSVLFVVGSYTDETEDLHLVHNLAGLAGFGLVFGAAGLLLAARPADSAAAFRALAIGAVVALAGGLMAGDLVSGLWFVPAVFALVLYALHPDRAEVTRLRSTSAPMLVLGLVAFVPAVVFALHQAELQRNANPTLDPHAEFHHYSGMAVLGLLLAGGALATATGGGGKRLIGWAAGLGAVLYSAASLAYADHVGAVDTPWALATLAWGVAVVALTELERRKEQGR